MRVLVEVTDPAHGGRPFGLIVDAFDHLPAPLVGRGRGRGDGGALAIARATRILLRVRADTPTPSPAPQGGGDALMPRRGLRFAQRGVGGKCAGARDRKSVV